MRTGYVWHEVFGWHDTGRYAGFFAPRGYVQPYQHFESAESKTRLAALVEVSGLADHLVRIKPSAASDDDLLRVHTPEHLARIKYESTLPKGGDAGDGTSPFGPGGIETAALAAGGTIAAVDAVVSGAVDNAYALVRPPGHHARPSTGMGFCVFANAAVAIQAARARHGLERVAVLDWDVHHGNGTQEVFYDDPNTLTISLHEDNLYPRGSGGRDEQGAGPGMGTNINVPLPAGSGFGAYLYAMEHLVVPALRRFRPDLVVVTCGFDASANDPLGHMLLTSRAYAAMTAVLLDAAVEVCGGRVAMTHEGWLLPRLRAVVRLGGAAGHVRGGPGSPGPVRRCLGSPGGPGAAAVAASSRGRGDCRRTSACLAVAAIALTHIALTHIALTADSTFVRESLASPKSRLVFGS